jgi:hypothetical protein
VSVEARLAGIEARLAVLEGKVASGGGASSSHDSGGTIASDRELDSEWGDPVVKKDPKRWLEQGGDSYAGCKMSECPSDYLNTLASLFDWMADQDERKGKTYKNKKGEDVPTAPLNRKSAAKARGWAKRNAGKVAAPAAAQESFAGGVGTGDDEIPFACDATLFGSWERP